MNRIETIVIQLSLNKTKAEKHINEIKIINPYISDVQEGDTIDLTYTFNVNYFDKTDRNLDIINKLLEDEDIIVNASINELNYGRSIIIKLVQKLTLLIDKLSIR